jgi:hypothetical protein
MKYLSTFRILLFAVFFIFLSCKGNKGNEEVVETPLYETAEFKEFYNKFSTDSAFQMDHVVFPLEGIKAPENDTIAIKHLWQREDWKIHTTFDDANGTFSVEMLDLAGKMVIEIISDESGMFTMERRFAKLSDGWNLIYYKEMGKYK